MIQRVKFGNYYIGDHAWISIKFEGNISIRTFPRLIGAKIFSNNEMGGGIVRITVHAWIRRDTREEIEDYFRNLPTNLGYSANTLTYGTKTIQNCVLQSISQPDNHQNWAEFTVEFITGAQNI